MLDTFVALPPRFPSLLCGHCGTQSVPKNCFLCWSFRESVSSRVPAFTCPVWLMSQEFPEAESPAGFAALEGSARFAGPAHRGRRPKNRSSNSQRPPLWSSHRRRLLRGLICRYPLGCHRRSPRSGVHCRVAHRGYVGTFNDRSEGDGA